MYEIIFYDDERGNEPIKDYKAVHSPQINTLMRVLQPLGYTLDIVPINDTVSQI